MMWKMIRRILMLDVACRRSIVLGIICNFLKSICMAMMLGAVYLVAAHLEALTPTIILQAFGVLCLSICGRFLFQWLMDVAMSAKGFEIFRNYRLEIGERMRKAPMGYFSEQRLGTLQNTLTTTVSELEQYAMQAVIDLTSGALMAVVMMLFFLAFEPLFAIITLVGCLFGLWILARIQHVAAEHAPKVLAAQALEYIRGIAVLRAFSRADSSAATVYEAFREKRRADLAQERASMILMKGYAVVFKLTGCVLMAAAVLHYLQGALPLAWCLMVIVSAFIIFSEMEQMGNGAYLSRIVTADLDRLEDATDIPAIDTSSTELSPAQFDITLSDVSFGYEPARRIIDHVSFTVPQGTSCAIVGPSGSGKTTLCNLIARFWDVDEGTVQIGGEDVREYTADSVLSHISMVFQNVYLFNDTVASNIRYGDPSASDEAVVAAAKCARCHDFIMALPNGYDTVIGEGGATLSGGERQRISIARAMLKDAPIVILDEATSSVDPENEQALLAAIEALTKGKTLITIAHRLKTVQNVDQIIVLDQGKIVERGDHSSLLKRDGLYRHFVEIRARAEGWQL